MKPWMMLVFLFVAGCEHATLGADGPPLVAAVRGQAVQVQTVKIVPGQGGAGRAALLRVALPERGQQAVLSRSGVNGDVETWMTADQVSFSLRQGVLVASRGLGFDLMGADVQGTLDALGAPARGAYRRKMRYLDGQNHSFWRTAGCSTQEGGTERGLREVEETCHARDRTFTNIYRLNSQGEIVTSRQWVGPETGYAEITMPGR